MNGCQTCRAGDHALLVWRLPAAVAQHIEDPCGSELARDGGVLGDVSFTGVHIRLCGNGGLWFRPDGGLLGKAPVSYTHLTLPTNREV